MRETLATYEKVDEPVDDGYRVRLAYEMKEGDKVVAGNIDEEHVVEVDENSLLPAIYENIIGMKAEEQKTFKVSFPEDFHIKDLAGKEVEVRLAVKEVMKKVLPEVNDEFAKKLKAKDLNELKDQIKKALESAYESLNKRSALNQVFNYLMEHLEVPLPKSMVEHQMEHLREDILRNWRSLEDYLKERGITEEEFNQEIRKRAERDVKAMIIMDALTKELGVSISPDDVRKLIETDDTFRMRFFQLLQSGFSPEAAFNDIYQSVLNELLARKVWDVVTKEFYKEGEEAVAEAINEALATGESSND